MSYDSNQPNKPNTMSNTPSRKEFQRIVFRKGSTAHEELRYKLCDITYGDDWHAKFNPHVDHWLKTGEMSRTLAEDVLYEFESMAGSYDEYFENRTYRRAVDSVINKVRNAFPNIKGWKEYLIEKDTGL